MHISHITLSYITLSHLLVLPVLYFFLVTRVDFFNFNGKIGRGFYALSFFVHLIIRFMILMMLAFFPYIVIFGSYIIFFSFLKLSLDVRRFHDIGTSGWWILLLFIPLVNFITTLILFFKKGGRDGQYDDHQKVNQELSGFKELRTILIISLVIYGTFRVILGYVPLLGISIGVYADILLSRYGIYAIFFEVLFHILVTICVYFSYSKLKVKHDLISIPITCLIYSILISLVVYSLYAVFFYPDRYILEPFRYGISSYLLVEFATSIIFYFLCSFISICSVKLYLNQLNLKSE